MFLAIEKAYTSPLSVVQVDNWLDYLEAKESGAWIFKIKAYDVKRTAFAFTLHKRGGGRWGPIYPWIDAQLEPSKQLHIRVRIRPSYSLLLLCFVVASVFLLGAWSSDIITIDGVRKEPSLVERFLVMTGGVGFPAALCYFKMFVPMFRAKSWLVKKLALQTVDYQ